MRSDEEVFEMINKLKNKNKSKHLTQGVSFNRECARQMQLLEYALKNSISFSGLVKEMLALRVFGASDSVETKNQTKKMQDNKVKQKKEIKDLGNFF